MVANFYSFTNFLMSTIYSTSNVLFSACIIKNTSKHEDIPEALLRTCQISTLKKCSSADVWQYPKYTLSSTLVFSSWSYDSSLSPSVVSLIGPKNNDFSLRFSQTYAYLARFLNPLPSGFPFVTFVEARSQGNVCFISTLKIYLGLCQAFMVEIS